MLSMKTLTFGPTVPYIKIGTIIGTKLGKRNYNIIDFYWWILLVDFKK